MTYPTPDIGIYLSQRLRDVRQRRSTLPSPNPVTTQTSSKYTKTAKGLFEHLKAVPRPCTAATALRVVLTNQAFRQSTVRHRRASFVHVTLVDLDQQVTAATAAMERMNFPLAEEHITQAENACLWLELILSEKFKHDCLLSDDCRTARSTKSASLKGLPEDWRDRLQQRIEDRFSRFWPAVIALLLTGCRPEEVLRGIPVTSMGDGSVTFAISSAKGGNSRLRYITILPSDPFSQLAQRLAAANESIRLPGTEHWWKNRLGDSIRKVGKELWPGKKVTISSYSLRHQMAADLKSAGLSDQEVAAAMGHSDVKTKSLYGRARHGRQGRAFMIRSEIPVAGVTRLEKMWTNNQNAPGPAQQQSGAPPANDVSQVPEPVAQRIDDEPGF